MENKLIIKTKKKLTDKEIKSLNDFTTRIAELSTFEIMFDRKMLSTIFDKSWIELLPIEIKLKKLLNEFNRTDDEWKYYIHSNTDNLFKKEVKLASTAITSNGDSLIFTVNSINIFNQVILNIIKIVLARKLNPMIINTSINGYTKPDRLSYNVLIKFERCWPRIKIFAKAKEITKFLK